EGLAPVIVQQIGETLAKLKREGFTIVLVEQNFRFAASVADRHYVVEQGKGVDMILNEDLDASTEKLHAYLGVQSFHRRGGQPRAGGQVGGRGLRLWAGARRRCWRRRRARGTAPCRWACCTRAR